MKTKLLLLFLSLFFSSQMSLSSIKDKMKVIYAYLPDRDLKAQHRIVKNEEKHIQVIYTKGEEDTYKMWIHKNEINENIFTLAIVFYVLDGTTRQ